MRKHGHHVVLDVASYGAHDDIPHDFRDDVPCGARDHAHFRVSYVIRCFAMSKRDRGRGRVDDGLRQLSQ